MTVPGYYGCDCDKYNPDCQCYPRTTYRDPDEAQRLIYSGIAFGMTRANHYVPDVGFRVVERDGDRVYQVVLKSHDGILDAHTITKEESESLRQWFRES